MAHQHEHAIVIGGSIAGLWTARILSDHFREVTVLERDRFPIGAVSRPGTPQDRHVHVLLQRGAQIMLRLFPGIEHELMAAGAYEIDLTGDGYWNVRGRWAPRFGSGKITYACSRVLFESIVRSRVLALPNVTLCGGAQAQGLQAEGGRVTGVNVRWKEDERESEETADLVVDASGRSSRTPEWLTALGYEKVEETVIDAQVGYAGRRYETPADEDIDWRFLLVGQDPICNRRGGLVYSEQDGVWMVMLSGMMADYPPTDEAGFNAFAQTVNPALCAALQKATPISNIFGYRKTENRFRHYEKFECWLDRFVVLGDAVCGFNPIYGQGMTVSAMAAEALDEGLTAADSELDGVAQAFQQGYPKIVEPAWMLATNSDLDWLGRDEDVSTAERFGGWYISRVLDAIPYDRTVFAAFIEVQNLMQPPAYLFQPGIARRVIWQWMRRGRTATPHGADHVEQNWRIS